MSRRQSSLSSFETTDNTGEDTATHDEPAGGRPLPTAEAPTLPGGIDDANSSRLACVRRT